MENAGERNYLRNNAVLTFLPRGFYPPLIAYPIPSVCQQDLFVGERQCSGLLFGPLLIRGPNPRFRHGLCSRILPRGLLPARIRPPTRQGVCSHQVHHRFLKTPRRTDTLFCDANALNV